MSEGSLTPPGTARLRSIPSALKRATARLFGKRPARKTAPRTATGAGLETAVDPDLRSRAGEVIRDYAEGHAALFERVERLREKAERLEEAGTPSESARNRAGRAGEEVAAGLAALRTSFATADAAGARDGTAGASADARRRAFDLEWERLYPGLRASGGPA